MTKRNALARQDWSAREKLRRALEHLVKAGQGRQAAHDGLPSTEAGRSDTFRNSTGTKEKNS